MKKPHAPPLHQRLRDAAHGLDGSPVTLADLASLQGRAALGSLLVLLAAPCVTPVPGVGSVLGLALMMLAVPMWQGRRVGGLPAGVAGFRMPALWARRVLLLMAWFYAHMGRWSRRRMVRLVHSRGRRPWMASLVAVMGVLIALPLPLGNVLPALSLALLGFALAFRDGLLVLLSLIVAVLACAYAVALGAAAWSLALAPLWRWIGG